MSIAADELDRLVDHVEVPQAEEVDLEQAERLDVLHRHLVDDLGLRPLLLQRDELDQRLGADHVPAAWIESARVSLPVGRARSTISRRRDRRRRCVPVGPGLERLVERLARAFRDELRDPVDDAVRDLEHVPVSRSAARAAILEKVTIWATGRAVLLRDVVDHSLPALDCEVDVDVGHVLASRVEEALEQQPVTNRVDVGDPEAVRGERPGGRAAARARPRPRSASRSR